MCWRKPLSSASSATKSEGTLLRHGQVPADTSGVACRKHYQEGKTGHCSGRVYGPFETNLMRKNGHSSPRDLPIEFLSFWLSDEALQYN